MHVSAGKTIQPIKQQFCWPVMAKDVDSWSASRFVCAADNQGKPGRKRWIANDGSPWSASQVFTGQVALLSRHN